MSASGMIDGVITNLEAASVIGASYVTTDYAILEKTSGCCAVVGWEEIEYDPIGFGDSTLKGIVNTILVEGYIRQTNNPAENMKQNSGFADKIVLSISSDDTLQGSVDMVRHIRAYRRPDELVVAGGVTWIPIYVQIDGFEFSS